MSTSETRLINEQWHKPRGVPLEQHIVDIVTGTNLVQRGPEPASLDQQEMVNEMNERAAVSTGGYRVSPVESPGGTINPMLLPQRFGSVRFWGNLAKRKSNWGRKEVFRFYKLYKRASTSKNLSR